MFAAHDVAPEFDVGTQVAVEVHAHERTDLEEARIHAPPGPGKPARDRARGVVVEPLDGSRLGELVDLAGVDPCVDGPGHERVPARSRAITQSIAVYPAVPIAMARREVMPAGLRTSQSPFTLAFWASPPQCDSPTPQPLRITESPGFHIGWVLDSTTPAKSMPGTMGQRRTMGEALAIARASL